MNFTENQQGIAILDKIRLQKDAGRFCDVVFHVKRKQYLAHRNVLAACSSYFDSVLRLQMVSKQHVNIHCQDHKIFELLLNFIYTGKVVIDKSVVAELLDLANQFMIPKLKDCCSEFLERSLDVANCFWTKDLAAKCGLCTLVRTVEAFLMANIMDVVSQDEIKQFNFRRIDSFISNRTLPLTEAAKLCLVCRWTRHHLEERTSKFPLLVGHLRWEHIIERTLVTVIDSEPLLAQSDRCLYHLLQTLQNKQRLPAVYETRLSALQHAPAVWKDDEKPTGVLNVDNTVVVILKKAGGENSPAKHSEMIAEKSEKIRSAADAIIDDDESSDDSDDDDDGSCDEQLKIADDCDSQKEVTDAPLKTSEPSQRPTTRSQKTRLKCPIRKRPQNAAYKMAVRKKLRRACMHVNRSDTKRARHTSATDKSNRVKADETTETSTRKAGRTRSDKLSCNECDYVAMSRSKLSEHVGREHGTDTKYECGICEFSATWNRDYYQHMKVHFSGPPFNCDHAPCSYTAERIRPLLCHRMIHTNERPYTCSVCNMQFRTKNNLDTHSRCHTGEKPYKCEVCGRNFATKGTLDQHSVTHSDQRPYLCESCGFSTKYQSHLIAHKRIHTGDVFRCQSAGCSYTTPKRSQLACHMRSHLSIRSHICRVCGRAFVEKSHLVRHERIHLAEKPFRCELCEYTSSRRDKLKEHSLKYHEYGEPNQVFKPRRQRRQSFTPHAFPGVTFPVVSQLQAETQLQAHIINAQQAKHGELTAVLPPFLATPEMEQVTAQQTTAAAASALFYLSGNKSPYELCPSTIGMNGLPPPTVVSQADRFVSMVDGRLLSSLQNATDLEATESLMTAAGTDPAAPQLILDTSRVQPISQPQQLVTYALQSMTPAAPVVLQTNSSQASVTTPQQNSVLPYQQSSSQPQTADLSGIHALMGMYLS